MFQIQNLPKDEECGSVANNKFALKPSELFDHLVRNQVTFQ